MSVLDYLSQYKITFSGLKEGEHEFDFHVDDKFYQEFEESEIKKGNVDVLVKFEKRSTHLILNFHVKGEVELICDRCLGKFIQPVENHEKVIVKFAAETSDEGDEIIYIPHESFEVELAQLIYEFIALGLPIRHIHPENEDGDSECDSEMLSRLEEYDLSDEDNEPIDPRWNDLKKLFGNKD